MKHLKTTIKLSVLALACLGAGALALQPSAYAKAEDTIKPEDCLTMVHGASVCVGDNFSGIRWTTKIDTTAVAALVAEYENAEITCGTLVMPTSQLGEDGVLTEEDKGAINIVANVDLEKDVQYFSTINYDNLAESYTGELSTEEALQKAYALELTARSYVKVNNNYYFTDMTGISTSRSARQVALAAELAGDLDKMGAEKADKAAGYYSKDGRYADYEVNTGKAGTKYVDLSVLATARQTITINVDLGIDAYDSRENTGLEVMIGAQRITGTVIYTPAKPAVEADEEAGIEASDAVPAQLAFNIPKGTVLPTGEHYISVFLPGGTIKTIPFICATMAFDEISDFDMFAKIRENIDKRDEETGKGTENSKIDHEMHDGHVASDYEFGGYYVLAKSLTWDAEKDTVKTDADENMGNGWRSVGSFAKTKLGLTGTFNGLGCWVRGYQDGRRHSGLFQLVNGGTIKNMYVYAYTPSITTTEEKTTTDETTGETTTETVKKTTYATNSQTFAWYMIDPKIENIYIYSNKFFSGQSSHYAIGGTLYQTEENAAKLSNIYARVTYTDTKASLNDGGLFSTFSGANTQGYHWNNVYFVCNLGGVSYKTNGSKSKAYFDNNGAEKALYVPIHSAYAENQKTDNGYTYQDPNNKYATVEYTPIEGGTNVVFKYKNVDYPIYIKSGEGENITTSNTLAVMPAHCLYGVYYYKDVDTLKADVAKYDFSAFTGVNGGNCWKIDENGLPAFVRSN